MPAPVVWICRLQALALVGGAIALVVLALTSTVSLGAGFLAADVVAALAVAAMLALLTDRRRARTPLLMTEILAALISTQLADDHRRLIAIAVGGPAVVAAVWMLAARREG